MLQAKCPPVGDDEMVEGKGLAWNKCQRISGENNKADRGGIKFYAVFNHEKSFQL